MSRKPIVSDSVVINAVQNSSNMSAAARMAGLHVSSFISRAKKLGVYAPNQQDPTNRVPPPGTDSYELSEILEGKHPQYDTNRLRKRLLAHNILPNICNTCGVSGDDIKLHLDHVNGISYDHVLSNLRLLCPNCHSNTPTFAGRNKQYIKQPTHDLVLVDGIMCGLSNTEILTNANMLANGANCKRLDKIREIVEHVIGRLTESRHTC